MILNEHVNENRDQRSRQEAEQVFRQGKGTPEAHRQRLFSGSLIAFHIAQIIDCENGDRKKSGGKPRPKNPPRSSQTMGKNNLRRRQWDRKKRKPRDPPTPYPQKDAARRYKKYPTG